MDILDVILDGSNSVGRVSSEDTSALVQLTGVAASATVEAVEQVSNNDEAMDEDRSEDHRAEMELDRKDNGVNWKEEEMVDDREHRGNEDNSPFQEEPCDENPAGDGSSMKADSVDHSELNRSSSREQNDGVDDSMDTSATGAQQKQQRNISGTRQQQQQQQHGRQGHGSKSTLGRERAYSGTEQSSVHSTTRSTDGTTARLTRSRSRSLTTPAAINAASSGRGSGGGGGIRAGSAGNMNMNMNMNINANVVAQQKRKLPAEPVVRRPPRRSRIPFDVTSMTYEQYCEKYYSVEIEKYKQGVIAKTFGPNVTYNPHAASARRNIHANMNSIHSGAGTSGANVVQNKANINLNYNNNINNNNNSSSMGNGNYGKYGPGGGGVMNMKGVYGNPTAATAISAGAGGGASGRPRSRSPATTTAGSAGNMGLYVKSLPNPVHSASPSKFVPDGKFARSPARDAGAGAATNRSSHVYDKNNDNNNNVINDGNDNDNKRSNFRGEAGDQQAAFLAASRAVSGFSSFTASGDTDSGVRSEGSVEGEERCAGGGEGGEEGVEKAGGAAGKESVDWDSSSTAEQAFAPIENALADTLAVAVPGGDGVGGDGDGSLIYDDASAATDTWRETSNVDPNEGEQQREHSDPKDSAMDTDTAGAEIKAANDQDFAAEG